MLGSLRNFAYLNVYSFLNCIPVLFGIGIGAYFSLTDEKTVPYIVMTLLCVSVLLIPLRAVRHFGISVFIILLGFSVSWLRTNTLNTVMLNEKIKYAEFEGDIKVVESTDNGIRFIVSGITFINKKIKLNDVSLTWRKHNSPYQYTPGDRLKFTAILDPIYPPTFRNAYNFRRQAFFNGISARGYITKPPILVATGSNASITSQKNTLRQTIDRKIDEVLDGVNSALVKTLITGNRSALPRDIRQNFADAGIAHILAISGLHIGIIAGFCFFICRFMLCLLFPRFSLLYDIKKISAVFALCIAFLYLQISGESVPAIRSFIMYSIIVLAVLLNRTTISMRSVSIAAMCILIVHPESMLFPSFQMSFSAVVALVAFYEKKWPDTSKCATIISLMLTSLIASAATSVFSVNIFNRLSFGGLISNLIAIPAMTFIIMPIIVISTCLLPVVNTFSILGIFMNGLTLLAKIVSDIPYASVSLPTPDLKSFLLVISGGIILSFATSKLRVIGGVLLLLGVILYLYRPSPIIYISAFDKVIGVNCRKHMCFNTLASMRRTSNDFIKSEAISAKFNVKHRKCAKCIEKNSDGVLFSNGVYIIDSQKCTNIEDYLKFRHIILNDKVHECARILYDDGSIDNYQLENRPWNN